MAKAGSLKLDFMAKSIGIHFFEFEDMFRSYRDNENLKKHFGHIDTLNATAILCLQGSFRSQSSREYRIMIPVIQTGN